MQRRMVSLWIAFVASAAFATACGGGVGAGGGLVGGTCQTDRDCSRRCVAGDGNFPGGYCTVSCRSDVDCPGGTACIDRNGGMCAVTCQNDAQCAGFGRGFTCSNRDRVSGGQVPVCRVD